MFYIPLPTQIVILVLFLPCFAFSQLIWFRFGALSNIVACAPQPRLPGHRRNWFQHSVIVPYVCLLAPPLPLVRFVFFVVFRSCYGFVYCKSIKKNERASAMCFFVHFAVRSTVPQSINKHQKVRP